MKRVILDVCVDISPENEHYPKFFFDDVARKGVCVVIGGSVQHREIQKKTKLLYLLNSFASAGLLKKIDDAAVDTACRDLISRINSKCTTCPSECDDPHLIALAKISGCLNILSRDHRMARCRNQVRNKIGHAHFPDIKIVSDQRSYSSI